MITEISIIELKKDSKKRRPFVNLPGIKSTNSVSLITRSRLQRNWQLVNNVLPQVPETRGTNITSEICEGKRGLPVTAKMANPGAKRKQIKPEENDCDPKVVANQFKRRKKFLKKGMIENFVKEELKLNL